MRRVFLSLPILLAGLAIASPAGASSHRAPAQLRCSGCLLPPDIEVHNTTPTVTNIASGDSHDFGATAQGTSVEWDFAVGATQDLSALHISSFTVPAGFSVKQAPPATIESGAAWSVKVVCDATSGGTFTGNISIVSDDPDESPFTIAITCNVTGGSDTTGAGSEGNTGSTEGGSGSGSGIPATGSDSASLLVLALGIVVLGGSAGLIARRRA